MPLNLMAEGHFAWPLSVDLVPCVTSISAAGNGVDRPRTPIGFVRFGVFQQVYRTRLRSGFGT